MSSSGFSSPSTVDPRGEEPREFGDRNRRQCPVVQDPEGVWWALSHAEVVRVAEDAETFSSSVSAHLQIPNGLDGKAHAEARLLLDRYLAPDVVAEYLPAFRKTAREVTEEFLPGAFAEVDAVGDLGATFAVRTMLVWLGWPADLEEQLLSWIQENQAASRSGDRTRTAAVAQDFDEIIRKVVEPRQDNPGAFDDATSDLIQDESLGRTLEFAEVVSILRNWTAGDLGSMALCIGVILRFLAQQPELQQRLREGVSEREFTVIMDEILRIDNPFVSNRRITTREAAVGGVCLSEGTQLNIHWTAANRDPEVFTGPDDFRPEDNAAANLVWGTGPHVCPGKPLSMFELQAFVGELLAAARIELAPAAQAERQIHPVGGWACQPVQLHRLAD